MNLHPRREKGKQSAYYPIATVSPLSATCPWTAADPLRLGTASWPDQRHSDWGELGRVV